MSRHQVLKRAAASAVERYAAAQRAIRAFCQRICDGLQSRFDLEQGDQAVSLFNEVGAAGALKFDERSQTWSAVLLIDLGVRVFVRMTFSRPANATQAFRCEIPFLAERGAPSTFTSAGEAGRVAELIDAKLEEVIEAQVIKDGWMTLTY
jgi:hypothetical protein